MCYQVSFLHMYICMQLLPFIILFYAATSRNEITTKSITIARINRCTLRWAIKYLLLMDI